MLSTFIRTFSHFPLWSLQRKSNPLIFSSAHMLIQKPARPMVFVRKNAGIMRKIHIAEKFIVLGINVSPAPTQTP